MQTRYVLRQLRQSVSPSFLPSVTLVICALAVLGLEYGGGGESAAFRALALPQLPPNLQLNNMVVTYYTLFNSMVISIDVL